MLTDKIIELRRKNNLSEEELSEIVDVSKLTISKWEAGEKTPNLDQLSILSKTFDVNMDYFIDGQTQNVQAYQYVSYESAMAYVDDKRKVTRFITIGVFLSIVSIVPLLLLIYLSNMKYIGFSSNEATTIGLTALFALIAVAVGVFLQINRYSFDLDLEHDKSIRLNEGVKSTFKTILEDYRPVYIKKVTLAIAIILLSTVPLIAVSILTQSGQLSLLMVIVKLVLIAIGVSIIIPTSLHFNILKAITRVGDTKSFKSREEKRTEKVASFYWPLVTAVYLAWSLWTMAWGTTWILWPVAALVFIAIVGLMGLLDSK